MIKCIVFDFDGVLIHSHNLQRYALKTAYQRVYQCQDEPPYETFFLHSGNSLENIFHLMRLSIDMVPIYRRVSEENIQMVTLHDGVPTLLQKLKERGVHCAICTGKDRKRTMDILRRLRIDTYFDLVIASDDVRNPKPNPESLLKVMHHYAVSNQDMVMVGDGINDIRCAKAAIVESIAVTWGDVSQDSLVQEQPTRIVSTIEMLGEILYSLTKHNESEQNDESSISKLKV